MPRQLAMRYVRVMQKIADGGVRGFDRLAALVIFAVMCVAAPQLAHAGPKRETFDIVKFTPPTAWKKVAWTKEFNADKSQLGYTVVDQKAGTYCRIFIVKSTISEGSLDADFASEWKLFISNNREMLTGPQLTDAAERDGWKVKAGVGTFSFDGGVSIGMLTSISGYGRVASVVMLTSSEAYLPAIQAFLGSIEMVRPRAPSVTSATTKRAAGGTVKPQALQGYMDYSPFTKTWTWKLRYPPPIK